MNLRITEIFYSIQGETNTSGLPTTFIRLTGCPLRCTYCDTAYAFHGGQSMALADILKTVQSYPTPHVTVTGGEPLAQKGALTLLNALCDLHFQVSLETSGALSIADVDPRVSRVLDIKTPGSGEASKHLVSNYAHLTPHDQIKCVVTDRQDYEWAKEHLITHNLLEQYACFLSPCTPGLSVTDLANWIIEDRLQVRLQIQLHKIIWGDTPGK